jgi:phosphatidate cytidylyltransferase
VSEFDDERPEPPPTEGVRIIGAEEAQAAAEQGPATPEQPSRSSRRRSAPPDAARFPLPGDRLPEDLQTARPSPTPPPAPTAVPPSASTPEPGLSAPLQHWTEPPTGEVPMIGGDDFGDDEIWSTGPQPRFRAEGGDWGDDAEHFESLSDDTTAMGALVDEPEIDDDEEFAAQVAARRAPSRRNRGKARTPRGRAAAGTAAAAGAAAAGDAPEAPRYPTIEDEAGYAPQRGPAPTRDDLPTRVITAVVLVAVALLAFFVGRAATAVLVTVILTAAAFELFEGFRRAGFQTATLVALLGCAAITGVAYNYGERAFPLVGAVVIAFTLFWYLFKVVHARPMVNAAVTVFGFAYVGLLGGFAGLLLVFPDGVGMVAGLVLCVMAYDIAGYFVGSRMGRRPLMPDVSPNKTVEGLVGGMIASVVVGLIIGVIFNLHPWNALSNAFLLGVVVAVFAPLGDLVESMLKRDLGLKDFGTILPGHGGVLDRFDAILFCLPAVYYLVVARGIV